MFNKKAQYGVLIAILIVFFLLVSAGIITYFVGKSKGWFTDKNKIPPEEPKIFVLARVFDSTKKEYVRANYTFEADGTILKHGELETAYNKFDNIPINKSFRFCYWNGDFYRRCDILSRSYSFKNLTLENPMGVFEEQDRKAKIELATEDKLSAGDAQRLKFNISATNGTLARLSFCTYHTTGFISLSVPAYTTMCGSNWNNFTYDPDGNRINLTYPYYWCMDQNLLQSCSEVSHEKCIVSNMQKPSRLKDKVDKCFYTGQSIRNDSYLLEIDVETGYYMNYLDYLKLYILDQQLTMLEDGSYDFKAEDEFGNDHAIPDFEYTLKYEGGSSG